ncbi:MAG: oligosaccharide flippase family protein [Muribaculaceae bacterium]|nr:oligosaccharide flippase family protein [Muribaculaceae bacterium]
MASIKSLARDTAVYGASSILGRFLNWCLVPLYTHVFPDREYGVVTLIYTFVAILLIILTYGMETGFFRFTNHDRWRDPMQVYTTALTALAVSSTGFIIIAVACSPVFAGWLQCPDHPSFVWMMAITVGLDAFTSLPFAYLRYRKQAIRFAALKFIGIVINIALNLFFIILCPILHRHCPAAVDWFYRPDFGIGYIFLSNLIGSVIAAILLLPELTVARWRFSSRLLSEMLAYSFPLLILGIAGNLNQTIDKILLPLLLPDKSDAIAQVGIYGANYKIAIVMVMFIQAFRFAYEPFIFAQAREKGEDTARAYSDAMKYFVAFAMFIFLGVMLFLPLIRYFIAPSYFSGLKVVPVVMIAELFFGIFFNLSVWYKISDRTIWGTRFSLLGLAVTVILNVLLVPRFGFMGCAWAAFSCYAVMTLASWAVGRRVHPIDYDIRSLFVYFFAGIVLWVAGTFASSTPWEPLNWAIRTLFLALYLLFVIRREPSLRASFSALTRKFLPRR